VNRLQSPQRATIPGQRAIAVQPVLTALPHAAAALFTLLTVGPAARQRSYGHVLAATERVDAASTDVLTRLTGVPGGQRLEVVRVAQSASLLARLMCACGRVAAEGRTDVLPEECAHRCRSVVALTEPDAAVSDGGMTPVAGRQDDAVVWQPHRVLAALEAASNELCELMELLVPAPSSLHPVRAPRSETHHW
jgi:hypothetical protein